MFILFLEPLLAPFRTLLSRMLLGIQYIQYIEYNAMCGSFTGIYVINLYTHIYVHIQTEPFFYYYYCEYFACRCVVGFVILYNVQHWLVVLDSIVFVNVVVVWVQCKQFIWFLDVVFPIIFNRIPFINWMFVYCFFSFMWSSQHKYIFISHDWIAIILWIS